MSKKTKRNRPATTPEARENQMINYAVDLAEQQIKDGTASSQVITHFLKLGTTKERIEKEILNERKELLKAQTEAMRSAERVEKIYSEALDAMRRYSGNDGVVEDD